MDEQWNIPEKTLKVAFGKLEIDAKYYPLFVERATKALNDIAIGYEPEEDDINASLNIASEYMNIYVGQIDAGLSETLAETYAYYRLDEDVDDSAWEAFKAVHKSRGYIQAEKELVDIVLISECIIHLIFNVLYFYFNHFKPVISVGHFCDMS